MNPYVPVQVDRQTWLQGLQIVSLPAVGDDMDRLAGLDVVGGYRSLAVALASAVPGSCAVQVRLTTLGVVGLGRAPVEAALIIRADSRSACEELHDLVTSALPVELVWRPHVSNVADWLGPVGCPLLSSSTVPVAIPVAGS